MSERRTQDQPLVRSNQSDDPKAGRRVQPAALNRIVPAAHPREEWTLAARDAPAQISGDRVTAVDSGSFAQDQLPAKMQSTGRAQRWKMYDAARRESASARDMPAGTGDYRQDQAQGKLNHAAQGHNTERAGQPGAGDTPQAPPVFLRNDAPEVGKAPVRKRRVSQARADPKEIAPVFRRQDKPKETDSFRRLHKPDEPKAPGRMLDQISDAASVVMRNQTDDEDDDNAAVQAVRAARDTGKSCARVIEKAQYDAQVRDYKKAVRIEKKLERNGVEARSASERQKKPKSGSNPLSRAKQKKDIRKSYSNQKRRAEAVRKAGSTVATAAKTAVQAVSRGMGLLPIIIVILLLLLVLTLIASCVPLAQIVSQAIVITTYPASETDILAVERLYVEKEEQLAADLANYGLVRPGFDAYEVEADEIWHDPHVLIAMISAMRGGEQWTIDDVVPLIDTIFNLQYEVEESSYSEDGLRICRIEMTNRDLSHLPVYCMSQEMVGLYAIYKSGLGNMPELFAGNPHASVLKEPVRHDIPQELLDADPSFAALIEEAEKYIGYPYVWGGTNPTTSFDCSGFVCWVYSQSGVHETGRLGATGLHEACTEVSADDVKPGDLVFFEGTMGSDVSGITHVGIYVGDNWMIHCGDVRPEGRK